ncbi:MAG: hypothetical protein LBB41_05510, partial [Prevotellaceae bacterium]|nr:hypothetical protein [Prevotellaceae bacterium]
MIYKKLDKEKWFCKNDVAVRGYCFDNANNFCENEDFVALFADVKTENEFCAVLQMLNGIFSVIIFNENALYAASDKSRIFQLFYCLENQNIIISDNPYFLLGEKPKIDAKAETEFLLTSFTLDEKTLLKNIFQIKPSNFLIFEDEKARQTEFYSYCIKNEEINLSKKLENDFVIVLKNVFLRLIRSANGRQIVVPLSGGYDSRLIVAMLKTLDYKNVVCYTVGREGNAEYQIARQVAERLDYKYHFIFTGDENLLRDYTSDAVFQKYYKFSASFCNSFWMYEYFGVKYLIDNNLIEKNAIFVPGHSGDFLAGSQTTKMAIFNNFSQKKLLRKITEYTFIFGKAKKNIVKKLTQIIDFKQNVDMISIFDDFLLKVRLPKLTNNAVRLYEFFGYQARLPFWDNV